MHLDAHVHFMPPELAEHLSAFAEQEPYWGLLLTGNPPAHSVQGWASPERMIDDMDRAGIDRVLIQSEYRMTHQACVARNNQALELVRRWPNRVSAFACLQPKAGAVAMDELQRCLDGGLLGVGELNPYGQAHTLEDPDFLRMVEACIRHNVPLNLHVSEEIGHFYLGKTPTPLMHYYQLACRYPELKLVLAHWGGGLLFYEIMPEVRRALRNVWYDTAASPLLFPTERIFRQALQCVDHTKLLYGSDYPLLLYPRRQAEPDFRPFLGEIDCLGLSPEVYADLMGNNAARLLGLMAPLPPTPAPDTRPRYSLILTDLAGQTDISLFMAISAVADKWPVTQAIFEKHGLPWRDSPVAYWEPIAQAAAARGWTPTQQLRLLAELRTAIAPKSSGGHPPEA
jgi:predicted TIM-barrel fold metal-dependent hydrolase